MQPSGLTGVRREYDGGNVRMEFPVRPLGWGKLIGVFLLGFGALFSGSSVHSLGQVLGNTAQGNADVGDWMQLIFSLPFLIGGLIPTGIGLLILFGRSRVEWRGGQLSCAEILGPLRWTRRLPCKPLARLEISVATSSTNHGPAKPVENFSGITAIYQDGSKKLVVLGYPKTWLQEVAAELKTYISGSDMASPDMEIVEQIGGEEAEPDDENLPPLPPGSRLLVEERGAGVRITIPPAGLWRGSKGLFMFALFWCGFTTVFTSAFLFADNEKGDGPVWVFVLFIFAFWAIGVGLLLAAINMGRRSAEITAESTGLFMETKNIFGVKKREWRRGEIAAIRADVSGMEVNDRPVIELQIHPVGAKKAGVLAGRDEDELRWLAARLRRALKVPSRPDSKGSN